MGIGSFVDGSFYQAIEGMPLGVADGDGDGSVLLTQVTAETFETLWSAYRTG